MMFFKDSKAREKDRFFCFLGKANRAPEALPQFWTGTEEAEAPSCFSRPHRDSEKHPAK